ncbi:hypothetical protein [Photobacterium galatheae]|uniref:Flagellar motor switch protein FliN-like C-terminal domain-containing protein n=1 Tax=Photobacterium galatheae TaxID=1654360 RepID=A0A066RU07_9GAMM|nr:hypothetical protein [Photobacterium galatheae]KDM90868.1 hypothetical protein EA58_13995 [Photobacterium galatheae]MCM0149164.1 hypothetical protein [Photobacterium galatheae]
MFIKKTTLAEFESQQQAIAMRGFASTMGSKICALTRGNLSIPMVPSGQIDLASYSAKAYIESVSPQIRYKIGVQFDESSFIAIGFNSEFLSKCAYYWAGGRISAPEKDNLSKPTSCEVAFLREFMQLILPAISEELNKHCEYLLEVSELDDNGVAFRNDQRVQINTVSFTFKDEVVQLSIITSDGVLKYCNLNSHEENDKSMRDRVDLSEVKVHLDVCFEPFMMTLGEVKKLRVGDELSIASSQISLMNRADKSVIAQGILGSDANQHQQLIQIRQKY